MVLQGGHGRYQNAFYHKETCYINLRFGFSCSGLLETIYHTPIFGPSQIFNFYSFSACYDVISGPNNEKYPKIFFKCKYEKNKHEFDFVH